MSPLATIDPIVVHRFEEFLPYGLRNGLKKGEQVCIMGAVNIAARGLSLELGIRDVTDSAECAAKRPSSLAIQLNDRPWTSPTARAAGLRRLGLALLGSQGIDESAWARDFCNRFIAEILPATFRRVAGLKAFEGDAIVGELNAAADQLAAGTIDVARAAAVTARKARAVACRVRDEKWSSYYAAAAAAAAADAAADAAYAAFWGLSSHERDEVLTNIANLAADTIERAKAAAPR